MKALFLIWVAILPLSSMAQKAYELVTYTGKTPTLSIKLSYTDGYLAGCEIKATNLKTKAVSKFSSEAATPDEKQRLVFIHCSANQQVKLNDQFILDGIDEGNEAPGKIKGKYLANGKVYPIVLTRTGKR